MGIKGVETPKEIKYVTGTEESAASSDASGIKDEATEGVEQKIVEKVEEAVEALKVTLADTDGDGQDHSEL
jgi:chaperonin GroEL (HSP60 family)